MSTDVCPVCGSSYVRHIQPREFVPNSVPIDDYSHLLYCEKCRKYVPYQTAGVPKTRTWLMSLYDLYNRPDLSCEKSTPKVEIYKNNENEIECVHRRHNEYRVHNRLPKLTLKAWPDNPDDYKLYCGTFISLNDEKGDYFDIDTIEMNKELTSKALANPAMNNVHKQDGLFEIGRKTTNKQLKTDIFEWIRQTLQIRKKIINAKVIAVGVVIALLLFTFGQCSNQSSQNHDNDAIECKSCHRTFYPGDSAGNYMNIARTGMCNNCYDNFKWAQDVLGK